MIGRTLTVAKKEWLHIIRDLRTLAVVFLMPMVLLRLLAYATTTDGEHLHTAVFDADRTPQSRELIDAYCSSNDCDVAASVSSEQGLAQMVEGGKVRAGLIIPAGYGLDVTAGRTAGVALIVEGSEPTIANTAFATARQFGQAHGVRLIESRLGMCKEQMAALEVHPGVWYDPEPRASTSRCWG